MFVRASRKTLVHVKVFPTPQRPLSSMVEAIGPSADYYRRGESLPLTLNELACQAIINAANDAGIAVADIDGFSYYSKGFDTNLFAQMLGIKQINFSAIQTYGGNGSAGCAALASVAVVMKISPSSRRSWRSPAL